MRSIRARGIRAGLAACLTAAGVAFVPALAPRSAVAQEPEKPVAVPDEPAATEGTTIRLTIEEAVQHALVANEGPRIARAAVDRTRGQVREAFALALPTLDGSYQLTRNLQRPVIFFNQGGETQQISIGEDNEQAFTLSLEQTIFDRSLGAAVEAARHGNAASEANYERALADVALETREEYYDALLAEASVEARRGAIRLAEARVRQVELFVDVGTASEFDLLTAQVDLENQRPELIRAENDYNLALNALKRVAGLPFDAELELVDSLAYDPAEIPLETAVQRALAARGDLEAQERTVELREELVNVATSEGYPTLALRFDLSRRSSSEDLFPDDRDFSQSASAALALDIPIFDGRQTEGQALQARADFVEAQELYHALERDVRLGVLDAWQSVEAARQAVEATRATEERARRAYEIARVRFRNGLSTQLELDEAEQSVVEAELNAAQALHDHMAARARLRHEMGER